MKIILIFAAVLVAVIVFPVFSKVWIESDAVLENFNAEIKLKIKILTFFTIKYDSTDKKRKKKEKKSEKKIGLKDLKGKKIRISKMMSLVSGILKNAVRIKYFETDVNIALDDPMNTGLVYSAVMASANIFYKSIYIEEPYLDVKYDFDSETGIILKHKSKIYIRPINILKEYVKYILDKN